MKLISKEELRDKMYHEAFEVDSELQKWDSGCWVRYKLFEQILDKVPTIESREKGKWVAEYTDIRGYTTNFQCSNCYRVIDLPELIKVERMDYDYCPYCGADKRGDK